MNIVSTLEAMGVSVRFNESGVLALAGLRALSAEERRAALELAKRNKAVIVGELQRAVVLPPWMRLHSPGELLDGSKEKLCASPRCGAVFMRQPGEAEESWRHKRYCSGQCFSGAPLLPPVEVIQ